MKYLYILLIAFVLFSCEKEQDLGKLNETIYVRNDGADMPVYMRGNMNSKVVVLIVHGGPGGNGLEYRDGFWTVDLEEKYAMAYWDQRGQGMSQGHYSKSDVTVAKMVEDMDAVIEVLKAKYGNDVGVFALGHSWGGTLTAKYMTTGNLQHNLKGWIESNGAHDNLKNYIEATKMFVNVANEQIALENNIDNWESILDWVTAIDTNNITYDQTVELNENAFEVEDWLLEDEVMQWGEAGGNETSMFHGPINPLTSFLIGSMTNGMLEEEVEATTLTNELYKITIPVLALWGKYDFVVPPTLGYDTYNNISSTTKKLVIFEKSGHSPMNNEWRKFTDEVMLFIDANK
ncbi:MAG: alpha/beta fold hydrolase [Bacteroidales bacterium]|nr:alpha/beta fold hydrolase [Bacteroidales bacterium]